MLNDSLCEAIEFDKLNPIERYKCIRENCENRLCTIEETMCQDYGKTSKLLGPDIGEIILIALYTIDYTLKDSIKTPYSFYVKDDKSIKRFIEVALGVSMLDELYYKGVLRLDAAKFIYRFTCAKKFLVEDESIKQLRLNSWGREYIKSADLLRQYKSTASKLENYFKQYYCQNEDVYRGLSKYLLMQIDTAVVKEIRKLNEAVEIKLLS